MPWITAAATPNAASSTVTPATNTLKYVRWQVWTMPRDGMTYEAWLEDQAMFFASLPD